MDGYTLLVQKHLQFGMVSLFIFAYLNFRLIKAILFDDTILYAFKLINHSDKFSILIQSDFLETYTFSAHLKVISTIAL